MKKVLLLILSLFIIAHADINKLTGQANFAIDLGPYAKLQYKGGVGGDVIRPNEQSPAGIEMKHNEGSINQSLFFWGSNSFRHGLLLWTSFA